MKIIIDAMGGDNAPGEIVKGAIEAARDFGVEITLVGKENEIRACLANEKLGTLEKKNKRSERKRGRFNGGRPDNGSA
ncbi:MAG: hypothetical protein RR743_02840 [Oscillospiraceae bacterium]